ncbi:hypothetical protein SEVIR_2G124801v4 [Setaria viridis]
MLVKNTCKPLARTPPPLPPTHGGRGPARGGPRLSVACGGLRAAGPPRERPPPFLPSHLIPVSLELSLSVGGHGQARDSVHELLLLLLFLNPARRSCDAPPLAEMQ